jgi:hypothetical protein
VRPPKKVKNNKRKLTKVKKVKKSQILEKSLKKLDRVRG